MLLGMNPICTIFSHMSPHFFACSTEVTYRT
jgi:hypothetical protein